MPFEIVQADIFAAREPVIAHGCNAKGVMGRGFALQVRQRYPDAFAVYEEEHRRKGLKPGTIVVWNGPATTIVNCITQDSYGRYGQHVSYDAIVGCMREIEAMARRKVGPFAYGRRLAMPRIGSDRGGGDWNVIQGIVETELRSVEVVVYELGTRPGR